MVESGYGFSPEGHSGSRSEARHVMITFDDGYAELAELLPPLMEKCSFKPMIFIPTAYIGRPNVWDYTHYIRPVNHLSRSAISYLSKIGAEFGTHGHSHTDLTTLSPPSLNLELRRSKDILEGILNRPVTTISYPFGRQNREVAALAIENGYVRGYTMRFPSDKDLPLAEGRIAVYGYDTRLSIARKLGNGPGRRLELVKAEITNRLAMGTVLLNRIRGLN
jgi:peptidoglycan/xylan/chitin deacetylase (PgdA/CDA1 family)